MFPRDIISYYGNPQSKFVSLFNVPHVFFLQYDNEYFSAENSLGDRLSPNETYFATFIYNLFTFDQYYIHLVLTYRRLVPNGYIYDPDLGTFSYLMAQICIHLVRNSLFLSRIMIPPCLQVPPPAPSPRTIRHTDNMWYTFALFSNTWSTSRKGLISTSVLLSCILFLYKKILYTL